jgi:hypothetical protein
LKENINGQDNQVSVNTDKAVSAALSDFARTELSAGAGDKNVATMTDAARTLAYYYVSHGMKPSDAAKAAVNALTSRWDFSDTFRTPKGLLKPAEEVTSDIVNGLKADDIKPWPARPNDPIPDDRRLQMQLAQAQHGKWVVNENETGLVLLYPDGRPVIGKDGHRIERNWQQITDQDKAIRSRPPTTSVIPDSLNPPLWR